MREYWVSDWCGSRTAAYEAARQYALTLGRDYGIDSIYGIDGMRSAAIGYRVQVAG